MDQTADDLPTENSPSSSRPPSLSAREQRRLAKRFELTIPLKKPLTVKYRHVIKDEFFEVTGLPERVRRDIIYVRENPSKIVPVPIACIVDIKPAWE